MVITTSVAAFLTLYFHPERVCFAIASISPNRTLDLVGVFASFYSCFCINKSKENSRYHREERSSIKWPKNPLFLTCLHSFRFSLARDMYDSIAFTFLAIFSVKTFRAQADIIWVLQRHSAFTSIQAWFWKTRAISSPDWRTYTCQDKINKN